MLWEITSTQLPTSIRNTMSYEPDGLRIKLEESTSTKKFIWDEQAYLAEADANNDIQTIYTNAPCATAGLSSSAVAETDFSVVKQKGTLKLALLNDEGQPSLALLDKPDSGVPH